MARHLVITGKVQGVGYRASFESEARRLGLWGWVRNRTDGSVEAMVDGEARALEAILAWARRGPASARVDDVVVEEVGDAGITPGRFDVVATG
ncbi:acylphosphatase [Noviherbaspirillum galbum]|uniref:acylphosphatase n=1 Tax=Noviherbaspirillum galbum TaxID=2709383 RepID=A0A6B3SRB1_9BURK|nr:acylphosphatase [Noviherbaspirillum galbum]NEX61316.1 acylphosphatase [Noviherbaspirillum galbum]